MRAERFGIIVLLAFAVRAKGDDDFEKRIRPLLDRHCLSCHGEKKQKGGLRLDSKAGWRTGGDSGPAVLPGDPDGSRLIQAVRGKDGVVRMPPKGRLSDPEIAALVQWVKDGANDPRDGGPVKLGGTTLEEAKRWWSFQPVKRPSVPSNGCRNPIDAFISSKLSEKKLKLSPPADKRTLLRRATYDLTGLPPTMKDVESFERDESPNAFTVVVDRLLSSRHYGEHWGRHWLDLVRYADTAGENSDHPLPHAWRYRNWVIDSLNGDQPYDEFLREQIAGDILAAKGPPERYAPRVVATGFLALARRFEHDSDKAMHLTHEDGIDTIGKAFLGLTIGCARCHDHKYDAFTTRDYYALYGILDSTKFSFPGCEAKPRPRDLVPLTPPAEWDPVVKPFQAKLAKIDSAIRANADSQLDGSRAVQDKFVKSRKTLSTGEILDGGEKRFDAGPQAIEVKAGEMVLLSITPLKNHGADTTLLEWEIAEVGGQARRWNASNDLADDLLAGNPHADRHGNKRVWWLFDVRNQPTPLPEAVRDANGLPGLNVWRNGDTPSVVVNANKKEVVAWTKLPARSLFVHPAPNGNVAVGWLSPITGQVRISGRVKDAHPGGPDGVGWVLERFAVDVRAELFALANEAEKRPALERTKAELLRSAPQQDVAYAVVEGKPADARIHLRGDPEKPGDPAPRRWLEVLGGQSISAKSSSGRHDLADWIASKENPLTARVMVNRLWLHHFGKGLVKTPNDFGTRGLRSTHPELLDWLAAEFVAAGWSLKAMHRRIMLSDAYRQASASVEDSLSADANNDLYWRFDRRRLTAEEIRDSLLVASGRFDRTPATAHPFPPESSWSFTQHAPFATVYETDKRSVYLINIRNRRHPFLGLFDGADPNATTPSRQTTTVPTQALYFMNDPFFHAQAEQLAARASASLESARLEHLFGVAFQRKPTESDRAFAASFLAQYEKSLAGSPTTERAKQTWAALARIVLASNEFLFVE